MRILITAGGTSEKIDQVRSITNHSSGGLGVQLAKVFLAQQDITIDYIVAKSAILPPTDSRLNLFTIEDTKDLANTLEKLLKTNQYTGVIHAMAVSDFTPEVSLSEEDLIKNLNAIEGPLTVASFQAALKQASETPQAKKISSDTQHLVMVLKQNPKVITMIKELQPTTKLVGFKLLVGVSQTELLDVATKALKKNHADYVFANDLETIKDGEHHGFLIDANGLVGEAHNKREIAQLIASKLTKEVR